MQLASTIEDGSLLELITLNQQRLVRAPKIIDAILGNAARALRLSGAAEETQTEFFEKERGRRRSRLPVSCARAARLPQRSFLSLPN